ncbi:alpha/beta-hydrolase [Xylariomycetidae sp. FL2044]|nr:alpha/beta-hydrolase [Xylariomycetidae sp. FL2044]
MADFNGMTLKNRHDIYTRSIDAAAEDSWPIFPQDDRTCVANATHFTGRVPVAANKELFFWFVESRRDPLTDPTILWMNGGPGSSSLPGLFSEIGPCEQDGDNSTIVNAHSWANFANLLFLDQPAGAGLSRVVGDASPTTLGEASVDFNTFLSDFTRRFPQYFQGDFYVAAESFAGHYASRFISDIVSKQLSGVPDAPLLRVNGIVLVDAVVDGISTYIGQFDLFCTDEYQQIVRFNASVCAEMADAVPEAEDLLQLCQETLNATDCQLAQEFARAEIAAYFDAEVAAEKYSPYDLRLGCELPDLHCIPRYMFDSEPYLSQAGIQKVLGIDPPQPYEAINFTLNSMWSAHPSAEIYIPTTQNVSWLLDEGDVRFLVINGVYDASISTPGMFREFDVLPWSQQDAFRQQQKTGWFWSDGNDEIKGGEKKGIARLQAASIYEAGHVPWDVKPAVASLVEEWLTKPKP